MRHIQIYSIYISSIQRDSNYTDIYEYCSRIVLKDSNVFKGHFKIALLLQRLAKTNLSEVLFHIHRNLTKQMKIKLLKTFF